MERRRKPKLSTGAKNKQAYGFRRRKWVFQRRMAAAIEVNHRRDQIKRGELMADGFDWGKQFIPWWKKSRMHVLKRDRFKCRACGKKLKAKKALPVHHIVPRKYGGDERSSNLISLCESCHKKHETKLKFSGLFDLHGKWRGLERKQLLVAAVKASGLKEIVLRGPPKE